MLSKCNNSKVNMCCRYLIRKITNITHLRADTKHKRYFLSLQGSGPYGTIGHQRKTTGKPVFVLCTFYDLLIIVYVWGLKFQFGGLN